MGLDPFEWLSTTRTRKKDLNLLEPDGVARYSQQLSAFETTSKEIGWYRPLNRVPMISEVVFI